MTVMSASPLSLLSTHARTKILVSQQNVAERLKQLETSAAENWKPPYYRSTSASTRLNSLTKNIPIFQLHTVYLLAYQLYCSALISDNES